MKLDRSIAVHCIVIVHGGHKHVKEHLFYVYRLLHLS